MDEEKKYLLAVIQLTFRLVLYEDFPKIEQCYHLDYHSRHQYMPKFEAFQSPKIRYVYADVGYLNLHESPRKKTKLLF